MERLETNLPRALLALAMAAAAALILVLAEDLTYFGDTWDTLMRRREFGVDALLDPHNEHIVLFPVLVTQLVLNVFGMTSATPEFVVLVVGLLAVAGLLYVYVSRRVGPWLGLFAAVLVLFLGPAWEVLLWTYEIGYVGSVLFGLAALLALERGDRRGDLLACLALVLAAGFSSLGIPFAVAAAVAILQGPRQRWLGRAYVVAVPALLFLVWYLGWGHEAESHLSLRNVLASPRFVAEEAAVGVGALFGLGTNPATGSPDPVWGRGIVVALVVGLGVLAWRRASSFALSSGVWPVVAAAATNWFLTAFNAFPGRDPASSRYQYASAILILMILANLLRGVRFSRRGILAAAAVTAVAVAPNLVVLKEGKDFFAQQTVLTRSGTAAIEIARDTVAPDFQLNPEVAGTASLVDVFAEPYLTAVDEHGSPAYTVAELETSAPAEARGRADVVLAQALPLSTATDPGAFAAAAAPGCERLPAGEKPEVELAPGLTRIEVAPGPDAAFSLRRFAVGEFPVPTEGAPGGSATELTIPPDQAARPWVLQVEAQQPVRICRRG